ncbi:MAG TPA: sulfotransferase [Alphaproteobacteria bacterium]|nr:sulfotransferase [Alphaproteobacteria bacterium]
MNKMQWPERTATYRSFAYDSKRWDGFVPRAGDIAICTPPKCGTTWMQMICALLIFQKTEFDRPLSGYSPWLDMLIAPVEDVLDNLDAQKNRRFIKTHTPLDGLPYYEQMSYICVGRDPRDAFMSMEAHQRNVRPEAMAKMMENATFPLPPFDPGPKEPEARFIRWIKASGKPGDEKDPLSSSVLHYVESFWRFRQLPNILMVHYSDLKNDLAGEMRRIADFLDIAVREDLWPALVDAARFENMKANADQLAPDAEAGIWQDNSGFFNKGKSGQWADLLGDEALAAYQGEMQARLEPELAHWLEHGRLG